MKQKIIIASFLKPVNDIRSYEKIAKSLARNSLYKIYCIGYPSNIELSDDKITLLALSWFSKNGFGRIIARLEVFKYYIKVKPQLIIVNSPDLLILTSLFRIIFGGKIIYDIRENYFLNLWYQKNYKWGINYIFALLVRTKELITAPLFNHFTLAEKVYAKQLPFIKNRFTILENKCLAPKQVNKMARDNSRLRFLISGTIAHEFGIIKGVEFFQLIGKSNPNYSLKIIGHCPNKSLFLKLQKIAKKNQQIHLQISNHPIPHLAIENEILAAHFGLLPYQLNKSITEKWPTKLYEYMGYRLPFIIQNNDTWNEFVQCHQTGIAFDFSTATNANSLALLEQLKRTTFKTSNRKSTIFWNTEEEKLKGLITHL